MFDNEYQRKSFFIKALVLKSKILSKLRPVREMINTFLNPINSLVEFLTDLNSEKLQVMMQEPFPEIKSRFLKNYLAAMIEFTCAKNGVKIR